MPPLRAYPQGQMMCTACWAEEGLGSLGHMQKTPKAARPLPPPTFTPSPTLGATPGSTGATILRPLRQATVDAYVHQLQRSRRMGLAVGAAATTTRTGTAAAAAVAVVGVKRPGLAAQATASRLLREAQAHAERLRERASLRDEVEAEGGYYFSDEDDDV
jgi:hypothetical protein